MLVLIMVVLSHNYKLSAVHIWLKVLEFYWLRSYFLSGAQG